MRCRHCDYPLWNIRARQCPECGAPFLPSENDFVPNSVCFCCPHCDQAYYGTDSRGHLEPPQFQCVQCQQKIAIDEMIMRPAAGVDESRTLRNRMPWFERHRIGVLRAWWQTIGAAMTRPSGLIHAVPREHSAVSAWLFMFLTNLAYQVVGVGIPLAVSLVIVWIIGRSVAGMGGLMNMILWQSWWQLPLTIALLAGVPIFWTWLTHLLLMAVGAAGEPMRRTAHCIYYSSPANALSALPCGDCTQLAGQVWWVISAILMTRDAHGCSGGKATFAVLTAAIVSWGVTAGTALVVVMLWMSGSLVGGQFAGMGMSFAAQMNAPIVYQSLQQYAAEHDGQPPRHAVELLETTDLNASSVVITSSVAEIPLGDRTLAMFEMLAPAERAAVIERAIADLPGGVVAHRLGDVIFTWHGINLESSDQRLWVMLIWPQSMQRSPMIGAEIMAVLADGSTMQIRLQDFVVDLEAQNRRRAAAGLPPLPADLLSITHEAPATAAEPDGSDDSGAGE